MRGNLGDKVRLLHILEAIREVEAYTTSTDLESFLKNSMMRFACVKQLEIIGEAANHISLETKQLFPEIQWRQITGMRNIFVHEYFGIDATLAWEIIIGDIPILKLEVEKILFQIE